ncbi:aliphatic sulfonate ABC transporter substrate-binding protein [Nocardiopsis sp. MG754419]|uniref:aliphatic sulfonate ABC transporter substrate-binding protein n=1 Tax=Nocardiopsis sp. MG754419 TaxID=2259865 RepID=UPI001BAB39E6|nr:aliphatic sulfonate ABC transporter substrate-binding protein [Nocardiopsis sp. MG754419]MBR8743927.1 aliphatic sulfonates ABC transporter substrate-binding protein [Nocardiopsis sp. MG754419]
MNRRPTTTLTVLALSLTLTGCLAGEDAAPTTGRADTLRLDYAHYNVAALVVRDQGWLEEDLDVDVEWVLSEGSNKANENLRARTIDIGSTAGTPALLARANGTPLKVVDVYSRPEWSAIVVPADSDIEAPADLAGATVAATSGTDPYFFLLQTLDGAGIDIGDIDYADLQHADGRTALENGDVDAWAGLDPHMAASELESGSRLIHRDLALNSFGTLNADEDFIASEPALVQAVVDAYERARSWITDHPDAAVDLLAEEAGIDPGIAALQLTERTHLDNDPVPGDELHGTLERILPYLVDNGLVRSEEEATAALETLFDPTFARNAADGGGEDG